jgi:predicted transcriptional regulator
MVNKEITQVFGELEAEIMELVWKLKTVSVRNVLEKISLKRKIAYTTVMTVMSRLHDKGMLKRTLDTSGAYVYSATKTKDKFFAAASKKMIGNLLNDYGEVAVAQFFDAVESSNLKDLKKWQKKLKSIK